MESIPLILIADDPLARAGLTYLLHGLPEVTVIAQGDTQGVNELLGEQSRTPLPLILWDVGWDGWQELPEWLDEELRVLALITDPADIPPGRIPGLCAILPRQTNIETLLPALQAVAVGLFVIAPQFIPTNAPFAEELPELPGEDLTPREREVLQLLAEGMTNKLIAQTLHISDHTVKFHVNAIMSKLNAQSRTLAVVRATRLGLISL